MNYLSSLAHSQSLNLNRYNEAKSSKQPVKSSIGELKSTDSTYNIPFTSIFSKANNIQFKPISFKGHLGDDNPVKKMLYILTGSRDGNVLFNSKFALDHLFMGRDNARHKRWVNAHPSELLREPLTDSVMSLTTLMQKDFYNGIYSPDYGNNWGRRANYIEINPRALGKVEHGNVSQGITGAIKMLPAIPASQDGVANCVILSELFPTHGDNGKVSDNASLYAVKLNDGISPSLINHELHRDGSRLTPNEQVKAFNDLAHFRGLKTGVRIPLSSGQLKVNGNDFSWYNNENDFINACCYAVNLGFDSIFFDSARHVGGYDMGNYCGNGEVPNYQQMQYITDQIRRRTGRDDLSFVGEMADTNSGHFGEMGLSAGTAGVAPFFDSVKHMSQQQNGSGNYAAGPVVSNDNDHGDCSYEERRQRIHDGLFACVGNDKLPLFMQMHDLWPLNHNTNTHDLMMHSKSFGWNPTEHWNHIFSGDDSSNHHRHHVNVMFSDAANL